MGVFRSDALERTDSEEERRREAAPRDHRLDEPAGLSLGAVASQQSRLPFHPAITV